MSGGKKKTKTKQSTNQTIDPWARQQYTQQRDRVSDLLGQPFQPYGGQLTSRELSDSELIAKGLIGDASNYQFDAGGLFGEGADMIRNTGSYADFNPEQYVNPYADQLISQLTGDVMEAADRQRTQIASDALGNNAYGGARHGVREGMLDESALDTVADQSARIMYDAYNRGTDLYGRDLDRNMQKGGLLADMGRYQNEFDSNRFDQRVSDLERIGGTERAMNDRAYAADYAEAVRAREDYWRRIQAELGLLGSVPIFMDTESEGTSTQTTNPGLLATMGGIAAGAGSMFGSGGMFGAGGLFGGKS